MTEQIKQSMLSERTLTFLVRNSEIFLAKKKHGFGQQKYNGYGGKFDDSKDTSIEDTAVRELWEESGETIMIDKSNLDLRAIIEFYFPDKPEWHQRVRVYFVSQWVGTPSESDETHLGVWFSKNDLPQEMWDSDKYWLPVLMKNKKIRATFHWKEDNATVDTYIINEVESLM